MNKSKQKIFMISLASTFTIAAVSIGTILNSANSSSETNPLNRGNNYQNWKIHEKINFDDIDLIIDSTIVNDKINHTFSQEKINEKFIKIIKNSLKKIDKFKTKVDNFLYEINYKLNDACTELNLDVVWNEKNKSIKFFDQFLLKISE